MHSSPPLLNFNFQELPSKGNLYIASSAVSTVAKMLSMDSRTCCQTKLSFAPCTSKHNTSIPIE